MLTASPATIAWPSALMVAATVPVTTPARAARPGAAIEAPRSATSETSSMAARTARSASPSTATGVPQTAITASPMNFSIVPPYLVTTMRAMSKYRDRSSRTSSGSRPSLSGVKPTRSTNSTEHSRRSVSGPVGAGAATSGAGASASTDVPHSVQNRRPGASGAAQARQTALNALPHAPQKRCPRLASAPQPGHDTRTGYAPGRTASRTTRLGNRPGARYLLHW